MAASGDTPLAEGKLTLDLIDGGQAQILAVQGERVTVLAPRPYPPGSSLTGSDTRQGAEYRVKVRGCRRDASYSDADPSFLVDGRLVNLSKLQREALAG